MKETEVGMIPEDWEVKELSKITTHVDYRGKTPHKVSRGIQLITAKNIRMGYIDYSNNKEYVSEEDYAEVMKRRLPEIGDVLITTEAPCGYVAQIDNTKIALAQRVIKYRGNSQIDNNYLAKYFLSKYFQDILASKNTGGTVQGIKGSVLHTLPVILPSSIEEQQKIAAALSDIDSLISSLEEQIQKKKNIKQGAMQQLLTGKRRLPGFAKSNKTKQTELGEIPEDWEVKTFSQISTRITDGSHFSPKEVKNGFYMPSVKDMTEMGFDFSECKQILFDDYQRLVRMGCQPEIGDILIAKDGSILKYAFSIKEMQNIVLLSSIAIIKPKKELIDSDYISFYVSTNRFKEYALSNFMTGTGVPRIVISGFEKLLILIPSSKQEQIAIAKILSDMDTEINELESKLSKYRELKTGMMQQLLTGKIRLV